jgi:hypothetical protein
MCQLTKKNYTIKHSQTQHHHLFCISTLQYYYIYALRHVSVLLNHHQVMCMTIKHKSHIWHEIQLNKNCPANWVCYVTRCPTHKCSPAATLARCVGIAVTTQKNTHTHTHTHTQSSESRLNLLKPSGNFTYGQV